MRWIAIGIVLTLLGGAALWFGGIPYTQEETLELGPITASTDVERQYEIPPLAAAAVLALGTGLMGYGAGRGGRPS